MKLIRERGVEDVPPSSLRLDKANHNAILEHLRACLPNEGCGLLATTFAPDGSAEWAERFYPGKNIHWSPVSFEMDPKEVVAALKEIESNGWRLGAIVHSHPMTPPEPSATDLRQAFYPGALMLIVSFKDSSPELRAWQIGMSDGLARVVAEAPLIIKELRAP